MILIVIIIVIILTIISMPVQHQIDQTGKCTTSTKPLDLIHFQTGLWLSVRIIIIAAQNFPHK